MKCKETNKIKRSEKMEMRCENCINFNNGSCLKIICFESTISPKPNDKAFMIAEGEFGERAYARLEVSEDFGCILFEEKIKEQR
jgi:hypothetical protein